jgi:hypothetical protein
MPSLIGGRHLRWPDDDTGHASMTIGHAGTLLSITSAAGTPVTSPTVFTADTGRGARPHPPVRRRERAGYRCGVRKYGLVTDRVGG